MAKFKQSNLEMMDGQKLILDTTKAKYISYDGVETSINTTLSGVTPTDSSHLTTKNYVDIISGSLQTDIDNKPDILLELIDTPSSYSNGLYLKSTADGTEWATASGGGGVENHSALNELDYSSAGHTGFSSDTHLHDDRYYTESEVDTISGSLQSNIDGKSDTSHNHNLNDLSEKSYNSLTDTPTIPTDFYSQAEVDTISGSLSNEIDSDISTHSSSADHDDRYYTETELNAGQLDDRYYTESEVDTISGSLSTEIDADITSHETTYNHDNYDIAYTHSQAAHAPTNADNTAANETSHADVVQDGDFGSDGFLKRSGGSGNYTVDTNTYSQDSHLHDDRYYTESEVDTISGSLQSNIDGKSDTSHNHNLNDLSEKSYNSLTDTPTIPTDFYSQAEVDTISGSLSTEIDSDISTHSSSSDHDGRYYTESEVDALTWVESDITDLDKYTQSEVDDKWPTWSGTIDHNIILNTHNLSTDIDHNDLTNYSADEHRIINDVGDGATDLWSASKISSEINNASGTTNHSELNELDYTSSGHTGFQPAGDYVSTVDLSTTSGTLQSQINDKSDVNHLHDDRYYTESEVDTISGSLQTNIDDKPDTLIELTDTPSLYDTGKYLRSTSDGTEWATVSGGSGTSNHSELNELDYASSGHTGFSSDTHLHDDRYYTETELNDGQLDNRYYTESEVDTISGSLSTETDSDISAHTSNTDAHHAESHTITSHSDIVDATGANIEELTGGGDTTLHDHDGISENTAARHTESHSVASHSDTSATGAELNELTDGSETSLHIHDDRYYTESEVDTISGSLQTQIDDITVSGGVNTFIDLNDTPAAYSGDENKHVYVESDGTGLNFRYISDDDNYTEIIYSNAFPTQIDVYTNSGKTHQTSSTVITRISGVVSQTTKSIYDIDTGTSVVGTFTTTINRTNGRVVSTTSVRT